VLFTGTGLLCESGLLREELLCSSRLLRTASLREADLLCGSDLL
jgi:hypothetical protein